MDCSTPGFPVPHHLLKFVQVHVHWIVMPSNHLILCHPLLLLPSILPIIRVLCKESAVHIRWPTYWSFSFSVSPSNEHSRLISFRMDWFDLLAVQVKVFLVVVVFLTSLATLHFWLIFIFWINLLLVVMTANHSDWRCKRSSPNDASPATWRYLTYSFQRFTSLLLHGLTRLALKETSSLHSKETTAH